MRRRGSDTRLPAARLRGRRLRLVQRSAHCQLGAGPFLIVQM